MKILKAIPHYDFIHNQQRQTTQLDAMTTATTTTSYILSAIEPSVNVMSNMDDADRSSINDNKLIKINSDVAPNLTNLSSMSKNLDMERNLMVNLDDRDLWCRFQNLTNEMIVTKNGRRMFPVVKITASGLDAAAMVNICSSVQKYNF
jgi:hypothetical protein